ncbi:hypothetical protein H632_c1392p1 [Helicosporidium sp. ATCC 50920]|nr:hypothetical protein H632_c1392p1 [Helicosporidium sp. ATCC 50920]|eukprot:KDD74335.1 hypothetical protein H632_c1392p1 [Helicosporidium sp. ATCC 50920]
MSLENGEIVTLISRAFGGFLQLYLVLLFTRVLVGWFPTFPYWDQQPWMALRQVTDPYLRVFTGLIPPLMGTIDITPMVGFMLLQYLAGMLQTDVDFQENL